ncbi:MAG: hypothetical protein QOI11_2330 [Candidatus Eremiobacteraeota bacterium]|nr:hypothetical protein [Candidatus Eremiobacteraeota bacterium]
MSRREVDLEALFERDADTQLLERRRRAELGLAPHAPAASSTPPSFGAESIVEDDAAPAPARAALLRVELEARPERELIPGALVTVVASVHADGDAAAGEVTLRVALPPEGEPVPSSFARDDVPIDGTALLGEGLRLGRLPPGGTTRLRFALRVLPGTEPLDLVAHAAAPGVPAVGAPALRLHRRSGHAAYEAPRPFYELEPGEQDAELLAEPPPAPEPLPEPEPELEPDLMGAAPPRRHAVDTILDEPLPPPVLPREPEPVFVAEPEPPAASVAEPVTVPEPAPPAPGSVVLVRQLAAADLRAFERVFAGGVPHGLAALSLLAGIACTAGVPGAALGLESFRAAVAAALPRALVAARMGKPTPPVVAPEALAGIRPEAPVPPAAAGSSHPDASLAPTDPAGVRLVAALDARELEALRGVLRRDLADPFLRGAQVLLAVAPRALAGEHPAASRASEALAAFRVAAGAWLMRVTVRRAVDRRYDPLTADDAALRDAGAALVTALREVLVP